MDQAYDRFLKLADKKKEVFDEDLMAIIEDEIKDIPAKYQLEYLHTVSGTGTVPSATVRIRLDDGNEIQESAWGDGPVDAAYKALLSATGASVQIEEYTIRAITGGAEALGEVTVRISEGSRVTTGRGASTDVIEASAKAMVDALNRLAVQIHKERTDAV